MARGRALAHPVPARQTDLAIQLHGMNLPTLPMTGKGSQNGRVSAPPQRDRPAATVVYFYTAAYKGLTRNRLQGQSGHDGHRVTRSAKFVFAPGNVVIHLEV